MTASLLSPVATFEQRDRFNATFLYICKHGAFTDESIAALDRDAQIQLQQTAHIYARLYRGTDAMLVKFSGILNANGVLSIRQSRATLNAMYREGIALLQAKRPAPAQPSTPPPGIPIDEAARVLFTPAQQEEAARLLGQGLVAPARETASVAAVGRVVENGHYTVNMGDGTHVTLRLEDDFRSTAPEGSQVASYLFGSDNTSEYAGFAFVNGKNFTVWSKQRGKVWRQNDALITLLSGGLEAAQEAGHAYALESGRCARCGRLLTVEASVNRGLGPECAKKSWNA